MNSPQITRAVTRYKPSVGAVLFFDKLSRCVGIVPGAWRLTSFPNPEVLCWDKRLVGFRQSGGSLVGTMTDGVLKMPNRSCQCRCRQNPYPAESTGGQGNHRGFRNQRRLGSLFVTGPLNPVRACPLAQRREFRVRIRQEAEAGRTRKPPGTVASAVVRGGNLFLERSSRLAQGTRRRGSQSFSGTSVHNGVLWPT